MLINSRSLSRALLLLSFTQTMLADDPDPSDQGYVKKWVAIGDSYAAGIGAGTALDFSGCARYSQSYPSLMSLLAGSPQRDFQYSACSGAVSKEVLNQLKDVGLKQDILTVSSGGNDVDLVGLLNSCVYQWHPFGSSCDEQRKKSWDLIKSDDFLKGLTDLASEIPKYLNDGKNNEGTVGRAFWTGYASFFNADTTQCNDVTFSYWDAGDHFGAEKLSQEKRKDFNDMVDAVNQKIQDAIAASGSQSHQIQFVDMNDFVVKTEGRFCEDGVNEPDFKREYSMFYNTYTMDGSGGDNSKEELKRDGYPLNAGSNQAQIATLIEKTATEKPDLKESAPNGVTPAGPTDSGDDTYNTDGTISNNGQVVKGDASKSLARREGGAKLIFLPRHVTRVFHPRPFLHKVLADLIFYWMADNRAQQLRVDREPLYEDFDTVFDGTKNAPDPSTDGGDQDSAAKCSDGQSGAKYTDDFGNTAIDFYCSGKTQVFKQIYSGYTDVKSAVYPYGDIKDPKTDVNIIMRMYFTKGDGCAATGQMTYKPDEQECKDNFKAVMTGCQDATTRAGAYKVFNKGDTGCVAFDMMACPSKGGGGDDNNDASDKCDVMYNDPSKAFGVPDSP